jgi:hypothetical protein
LIVRHWLRINGYHPNADEIKQRFDQFYQTRKFDISLMTNCHDDNGASSGQFRDLADGELD